MRTLDQSTLDAFQDKQNREFHEAVYDELREKYPKQLKTFSQAELMGMIEEADKLAKELGFISAKGYLEFQRVAVGFMPLLYTNTDFVEFMQKRPENQSAETRLEVFKITVLYEIKKAKESE